MNEQGQRKQCQENKQHGLLAGFRIAENGNIGLAIHRGIELH